MPTLLGCCLPGKNPKLTPGKIPATLGTVALSLRFMEDEEGAGTDMV